MPEKERRQPHHNISGGGTYHLVDVFAHNAVLEIIQNARLSVLEKRGRFTLPSEFMDRLMVDCGKCVLDRGAPEAERFARQHINDFLEERKRFKHEDDERKVKMSLNGNREQAGGSGQQATGTTTDRQRAPRGRD